MNLAENRLQRSHAHGRRQDRARWTRDTFTHAARWGPETPAGCSTSSTRICRHSCGRADVRHAQRAIIQVLSTSVSI